METYVSPAAGRAGNCASISPGRKGFPYPGALQPWWNQEVSRLWTVDDVVGDDDDRSSGWSVMGSYWRAPGRAAPVAVALLISSMAGCDEPTSPGASISVLTQPSQALVGQDLSPPLEVEVRDGSGAPATGVVSVTLDPNPCEWSLGGAGTSGLVLGRASFPDLSFAKAGKGQVLKVSFRDASGTTFPIDVRASGSGWPLEQDNTLCLKPNDQGDAESLAYVPEDNAFWLADDDRPSIFQVDRSTGVFRSQISAGSIVAALPAAGLCDDGDGDPTTSCSYVDEFEHLAYDRPSQRLYLVNTVNSPSANPVVDKAAIFILRRSGCAGCFIPEGWQPLPADYESGPIGFIDGKIHMALGGRIYRYDVDENRLLTVDESNDSLPPVIEVTGQIQSFQQDGPSLWILRPSSVLKIDRATGAELARYTLGAFGIGNPHGIQVVDEGLYVLDGDPPNPVYVFRRPQ